MQQEQLADSIVKALAYTENGGKVDISNPVAGKTGEAKSIFQFTPNTWKQYSKEVLGDGEHELSPDKETYVVKQKVQNWIKEGKTARQIASMWNAGPGEPEAYTGKFSNGSPSTGINKKYGVKFDVPSYADKVLKYSKQFYEEKSKPTQMNTQPQKEALNSVMDTIKQASSTPKQPQSSTGGLLSKVKGLMSKQTTQPSTNNEP